MYEWLFPFSHLFNNNFNSVYSGIDYSSAEEDFPLPQASSMALLSSYADQSEDEDEEEEEESLTAQVWILIFAIVTKFATILKLVWDWRHSLLKVLLDYLLYSINALCCHIDWCPHLVFVPHGSGFSTAACLLLWLLQIRISVQCVGLREKNSSVITKFRGFFSSESEKQKFQTLKFRYRIYWYFWDDAEKLHKI